VWAPLVTGVFGRLVICVRQASSKVATYNIRNTTDRYEERKPVRYLASPSIRCMWVEGLTSAPPNRSPMFDTSPRMCESVASVFRMQTCVLMPRWSRPLCPQVWCSELWMDG
jgi:hypothetical protein